jgi:flagellar protein FlaG
MFVEPTNASDRNTVPLTQTGQPAKESSGQNRVERENAEREAQSSAIQELAADVQRNLRIMHDVELSFSVHESSGQVMVTVVNEVTGEKIREIPSREMLNLAAKFDEMIGMIFDQKG